MQWVFYEGEEQKCSLSQFPGYLSFSIISLHELLCVGEEHKLLAVAVRMEAGIGRGYARGRIRRQE